jgi:hypothetical protein
MNIEEVVQWEMSETAYLDVCTKLRNKLDTVINHNIKAIECNIEVVRDIYSPVANIVLRLKTMIDISYEY